MEKIKGAGKIKFALGLVGKIQLHKLNKAAKNCSLEQEKTLRGILEYAKDSEWGKAHNFAKILEAKDAQDLYRLWQENVPPQDYEDLRPFIERHKNGEANILFPGKPKMYATTSGTTKEPKWHTEVKIRIFGSIDYWASPIANLRIFRIVSCGECLVEVTTSDNIVTFVIFFLHDVHHHF